jgi:Gpi18-like mannosyltransferase
MSANQTESITATGSSLKDSSTPSFGGTRVTWPRRIVVTLLLTLLSSFFVTCFANLPRWGKEPKLRRSDYCKWDCPWFSGIATLGYEAEPRVGNLASWPFMPMFPITVAPAIHLLHMEPQRATVLMSKVWLFTAILAFLWMLGDELSGFGEMLFAATLVAFNPYVIYAHAGYSEPLYFTLAACGFAALQRDRFVWSGVFGGILSATRVQGVVFAVAYGIRCLRAVGIRRIMKERRSTLLFGLLLCPIGTSVYIIYLWRLTGDALAFAHVESAWGRSLMNPYKVVAYSFRQHGWESLFAGMAVAGLLVSLWLLRKHPELGVFLAISILLPCASGNLYGFPRYLWWQPPLLYAVFRLLKRYPQLRALYCIFAGGMAAITTYMWTLRSLPLI